MLWSYSIVECAVVMSPCHELMMILRCEHQFFDPMSGTSVVSQPFAIDHQHSFTLQAFTMLNISCSCSKCVLVSHNSDNFDQVADNDLLSATACSHEKF